MFGLHNQSSGGIHSTMKTIKANLHIKTISLSLFSLFVFGCANVPVLVTSNPSGARIMMREVAGNEGAEAIEKMRLYDTDKTTPHSFDHTYFMGAPWKGWHLRVEKEGYTVSDIIKEHRVPKNSSGSDIRKAGHDGGDFLFVSKKR